MEQNNCTINFPVTDLVLPGFSRLYRVVATCDHRGSLTDGHWLTNICTSGGDWYEINDLKETSLVTRSPGIDDTSVVIILLIASSLIYLFTYIFFPILLLLITICHNSSLLDFSVDFSGLQAQFLSATAVSSQQSQRQPYRRSSFSDSRIVAAVSATAVSSQQFQRQPYRRSRSNR